MRPEVQAEWHERTGYVPVTQAAYEYARKQGYYDVHPGQRIAIAQLLLHSPTRESRGIRLGDFAQVRAILEEELEGAWNDTVPPKLALDRAAERGNEVLRRFERANHGGAEPATPKRAPRRKK
jgi:sn-glycerol 3-phosphate transport system substrate-binding protein